MRILIISQVFYPDNVSVSQHLTDLAQSLNFYDHQVQVLTSRFPYELQSETYKKNENINGVLINRFWQTRLGKSNKYFRIIDFLSFNINLSIKLLFIPRNSYDIIFCSTSPPFLSFVAALISKIKNKNFYYWVMDLQPELSIASGLIRKKSIFTFLLKLMGNYSILNATKIISLDKYMTKYLISRGANYENIYTIPVWTVVDNQFLGDRLLNPFRINNNFKDRIVVMYSGNHSYVHHLDTLLQASLLLRRNNNILFVFIGEGVRKKDVTLFKEKNNLDNILQLPFQPRENIHISLASSDIQVVILGDGQVGYTHPNKIYGALSVSKPILYIGPKESHVTDIIKNNEGNIIVEHGEVDNLVNSLNIFLTLTDDERILIGERNKNFADKYLQADLLKSAMVDAIVN
jgi:colanic acid biosynthesis glycosyl transferase WcaI